MSESRDAAFANRGQTENLNEGTSSNNIRTKEIKEDFQLKAGFSLAIRSCVETESDL